MSNKEIFEIDTKAFNSKKFEQKSKQKNVYSKNKKTLKQYKKDKYKDYKNGTTNMW